MRKTRDESDFGCGMLVPADGREAALRFIAQKPKRHVEEILGYGLATPKIESPAPLGCGETIDLFAEAA